MMKVSTPLFQLKVLVNGRPVQEYRHGTKTYVEGRAGARFELQLTNLTDGRILAHPNIDGLSAMTGKDASRRDSDHGYIIPAHETVTVPGWRLNDRDVAEFFFAGGGKSYAEKSGRGKVNRGVIACTIWQEKVYVPGWSVNICSTNPGQRFRGSGRGAGQSLMDAGAAYEAEEDMSFMSVSGSECNIGSSMDRSCPKSISCSSSEPLRSAKKRSMKKVQQNLGAGFGDKRRHEVTMVSFTPATTEPVAAAILYYDDLEGLRSKGVKIPHRRHHEAVQPNPFPGDGCTPPPGWNG